MRFGYGEAVVRLRAPLVTNRYSSEPTERDWSAATRTTISGCGVADGGSVEPLEDARNSVESDFDVILEFGADVLPTDRLIVRGLTCQVQGRPFDWINPFTGWRPGKVVKTKVVEG